MVISSIFLGGIMDNIKYFFGVLVVLVFVWLKYKKPEPVEKVLFNLCIDVKCDNKKIEDEQYFSIEKKLKRYGPAIIVAEELLGGSWKIIKDKDTLKMRLIKGFTESKNSQRAVLFIEENYGQIKLLEKFSKGKEKVFNNEGLHVHLCIRQKVIKIGADECGLFIS